MDALQETLYWLSSTIAQTVTIGFAVLAFFIQTALQKRASIIRESFEYGGDIPHKKALRKVLENTRESLDNSKSEIDKRIKERGTPRNAEPEKLDDISTLRPWIQELQKYAEQPVQPEKFLDKWKEGYEHSYRETIQKVGKHNETQFKNAAKFFKTLTDNIGEVEDDWRDYFALKSATKDTAYKAGSTILAALIAIAASFVLTDSWPHMSSNLQAYYSVCGIALLAMALLIYLTWQCLRKFVDLIVKSLEHLP